MSNFENFERQEFNDDSIDVTGRLMNDLFYNTQDLEDPYSVQHQENKASDKKKCKALKNKPKKKIHKKSQAEISNNLSYVSRRGNENGHHLIKINIYELRPGVKCKNVDDSVCLSAQYVVEDKYDEILDCTENIVRKIVKKLSDSDSFKLL